MSYLYNKKKNIIELVDDTNTLDNIYFQQWRIPTITDINKYKGDDKNMIELIKKPELFIKNIKKHISMIEYKVPLYDIYTENMYLIQNVNVYVRVRYQQYRFPDNTFIKYIKEYIINNKKTEDEIHNRRIRKGKLIIEFMDNFDIDILENTYYSVMYKYTLEIGKNIIFCKKPSFNKYIKSSKPYYTRSEVINMALNMGIKLPNNYLNKQYIIKLCNIVQKNDISNKIILEHQKHIINRDALGIIQYYTIQGSYFINKYLRDLGTYDTQNIILDNIIYPLWKLSITAPKFDNTYYVYRFINDDRYLMKYKIGEIYEENGFMSTTRDPFYRSDEYSFGFILIKIKIPAQIEGVALCIESLSHFPEEQEIIFPPNSRFKIISKNDEYIYYHTDEQFSSKIKTLYEFEWIGNIKIMTIKKKQYKGEIRIVNFLEAKNTESIGLDEKIKFFSIEYLNSMSQFIGIIGNMEMINIVEKYDSTGAYKNFYAIKETHDGFSIYNIHNGYLLYLIEIGETTNGNEMHINYFVKYNTLDKGSIIKEYDFITYISSIAYYFGITNISIYAEYNTCINKYQHKYGMTNFRKTGYQRSFVKNINNKLDKKTKMTTINDLAEIGGNYCIDHYNYLKKGIKRFVTNNILQIELASTFSYYDLDQLNNLYPNRVLLKEDRDEVYQVYDKTYKKIFPNESLKHFIIWLIDNKCYLIDILIPKLKKIYGDNNPFENDKYILYPYTYLYNRKLISSYTSVIPINLFEPRNVYYEQKNEYRLPLTRNIRQNINN